MFALHLNPTLTSMPLIVSGTFIFNLAISSGSLQVLHPNLVFFGPFSCHLDTLVIVGVPQNVPMLLMSGVSLGGNNTLLLGLFVLW